MYAPQGGRILLKLNLRQTVQQQKLSKANTNKACRLRKTQKSISRFLAINNSYWRSLSTMKKAHQFRTNGLFMFSGERGIRTHGRLITYGCFQDSCNQPLCHLSEREDRNSMNNPKRGEKFILSEEGRRSIFFFHL